MNRHVTQSRWPVLSPLLDELLDLPPEARATRLAQLRAEDQTLADDLEELLSRQDAMEAAAFLDQPALLAGPQLEAGQVVGAYTLVRELGEGGMGTVWLARRTDGRFEGEVAIKFLTAGLAGLREEGGLEGRFAREGQILARLAHPHIARMLDAGVSPDSLPYLVLEYVAGTPITTYCDEHGLDARQRVALFLDVLAAVSHAHARLILHRDLKPSNILVTATGDVKLLDFGIAKLLDDSTGSGAATELTRQAGHAYTLNYAAPEQVQRLEVTTATDVYALGVLLYVLLGGKHPTDADQQTKGQTHFDRMRAIVEQEPRRLSDVAPGLRGDLDTIVAKALKKSPAERYANAEQLADDLRRWMAFEPISARPDSALYVLGRFARRHRVAVSVGGLAIVALIALTGLSLAEAWRADHAEQQAQARRQQADELLSYMLGDFADQLRPVGRLDLLDSVGSKALDYLARHDDGAIDPGARLQHAKALTVVGEVRVSKRELDAAVAPLQAAQKLLAGDPPTPALTAAWRKAQGAADFWVGHVALTQRRFGPAQQAMASYRERCLQWLASLRQDLDAVIELSYANSSLGSALLGSGELAAAEARFRESMQLKQRVLAQRPTDNTLRAELANTISWLGTVLAQRGQYAQVREVLGESQKLIDQVRIDAPKDALWESREALVRLYMGDALRHLGEREAADAELRRAAELARELLQREPRNSQWNSIGVAVELAQAELHPQPMAQLQRQLAHLDALDAAEQSGNSSAALRRLPYRSQLAQLMLPHASAAQALEMLTPLQARLSEALQKRPEDLALRTALARTELSLVRALDTVGKRSEAQVQCHTVRDMLAQMPQLLQVHEEVTRAWKEAQTCLNPS